MNPKTYAIVTFRATALMLTLQGQLGAAAAFNAMATALQAGVNIDAHMQTVADRLAEGKTATWGDIVSRIESETDEFLARDATGQIPE